MRFVDAVRHGTSENQVETVVEQCKAIQANSTHINARISIGSVLVLLLVLIASGTVVIARKTEVY